MVWRWQGLISVIILVSKDVYVLINYVSFVESFFMALSVVGLCILRYTQPALYRPIKVPLLLHIVTHYCLQRDEPSQWRRVIFWSLLNLWTSLVEIFMFDCVRPPSDRTCQIWWLPRTDGWGDGWSCTLACFFVFRFLKCTHSSPWEVRLFTQCTQSCLSVD